MNTDFRELTLDEFEELFCTDNIPKMADKAAILSPVSAKFIRWVGEAGAELVRRLKEAEHL